MVSFVVFCIVFVVFITHRFEAILSEKSGRGFSRFYFRDIKASAEVRVLSPCSLMPSAWWPQGIEFPDTSNDFSYVHSLVAFSSL